MAAAADNAQAFRKYLESAGVIDALTKGVAAWAVTVHSCLTGATAAAGWGCQRGCQLLVLLCSRGVCRRQIAPPLSLSVFTVLVSLYEEPDKPTQAIECVLALVLCVLAL